MIYQDNGVLFDFSSVKEKVEKMYSLFKAVVAMQTSVTYISSYSGRQRQWHVLQAEAPFMYHNLCPPPRRENERKLALIITCCKST